jgi:phage shock protein PspC (stress-responsive transcriptional regulator)
MKQVIQVSLNRNPWSIEIDAHAQREAYLAAAAAALAGDPGREEILLDLEQAIADQCKRRMPAQATVISLTELLPAIEEIGPVRTVGAASDTVPTTEAAEAPAAGAGVPATDATPPLQQISQGAWVSGVCLGLARYLKTEVTLLRAAAVLLLFFSGGTALLVYAISMLLMPFAPLDPSQPPPSKLAGKLREWTLALRGMFTQAAR